MKDTPDVRLTRADWLKIVGATTLVALLLILVYYVATHWVAVRDFHTADGTHLRIVSWPKSDYRV